MFELILMGVALVYSGYKEVDYILNRTDGLRKNARFKDAFMGKVHQIELNFRLERSQLWKAVKEAKKVHGVDPKSLDDFARGIITACDLETALGSDKAYTVSYQVAEALVSLIRHDPVPDDIWWGKYLKELNQHVLFLERENHEFIALTCGETYLGMERKGQEDLEGGAENGVDVETFLRSWAANASQPSILTLLGDFGSGKTWTLFRFAKSLIKDGRIPIFIPLRHLDPARSLEKLLDSIVKYFANWLDSGNWHIQKRTVKNWLQNDRVVWIFDGFDEYASRIESGDRDTLGLHLVALLDLCRDHGSRCRMLVSSRPPVFRDRGELDQFLERKFGDSTDRDSNIDFGFYAFSEKKREYLNPYFIHPFTPDQAKEFLKSRGVENLENKIWGDGGQRIYNLEELARTPVLLELIAEHLPRLEKDPSIRTIRAVNLYSAALAEWQVKLTKLLDEKEKEKITRTALSVARRMLSKRVDVVSFDDLGSSAVSGKSMKKALSPDFHRSGIMAWDEGGQLRFLHRSFMEFFQAVAIYGDITCTPSHDGLLIEAGDRLDETVLRFLHEWSLLPNNSWEKVHETLANWLDEFKEGNREPVDQQGLINFLYRFRNFSQEQEAIEGEDFNIQDFWAQHHAKEVQSAEGLATISVMKSEVKEPIQIDMVQIPAGFFLMGDERDNPIHRVTISRPFMMSCFAVSQALYYLVVDRKRIDDERGNLPVTELDWHQAVEFCNRLSDIFELSPAYKRYGESVTWDRKSTGFRLPTEAEWEYACRAGTTTTFCFGRCLSTEDANYDGDYPEYGCDQGEDRGAVVSVYDLSANAWHLKQMHGNVWDWVWDWRGEYSPEHLVDPTGPRDGSARVFRGGGWDYIAGYCRSAYRSSDYPGNRRGLLGFRLCRSLP